MDKKFLEEKRDSISQRFDVASSQNQESQVEIYRLQGEHRLITELIDNFVPKEAKSGK